MALKSTVMAYELANGHSGTVRIVNRALVEFDKTRLARKWPTVADAPFTFNTFTTWKSLQLEGNYAGSYEDFLNDCLEIGEPDDEPSEVDVPPTQTGTHAAS